MVSVECLLLTLSVIFLPSINVPLANPSPVSCSTPSLYTIQLPRHMYSTVYPLCPVHHPCTPPSYLDICTVHISPVSCTLSLYTIQLPRHMYSTINPLYPVHHPCTPSSYLDICTVQYIPCIPYTILVHHPVT